MLERSKMSVWEECESERLSPFVGPVLILVGWSAPSVQLDASPASTLPSQAAGSKCVYSYAA